MKHVLLAGLVSLGLVSSAQAGIIVLDDPGLVGDVLSSYSVSVDLGEFTEDVKVFFTDMKHLELDPQRAVFSQFSFGGPPGGGNFSADMEYGFLDEFGNSILSSGPFTGTIATGSQGRALFVTTPITIHGLFFNMSEVGPLNENARVEIVLEGGGTVGEWSAVPEPSTFALLGIGGIALVAYGIRRKRQHAA